MHGMKPVLSIYLEWSRNRSWPSFWGTELKDKRCGRHTNKLLGLGAARSSDQGRS